MDTRLQTGGTLFAKLLHQLERSFEALDSLRSAKAGDSGRAPRGSDSPKHEADRAHASSSIRGNARDVGMSASDRRAVTVAASSVRRAELASIDEAAARGSRSDDIDHGGISTLTADEGTPRTGAKHVDRYGIEAARMAVAAQAQPAVDSAACFASGASQRGDSGSGQSTPAVPSGSAFANPVVRFAGEAVDMPVVSSFSEPAQGTLVAIGLPRSSAQEVEDLRTRIAGEMARSGLTNYRLTINGVDLKRITPAGGHHGDR